MTEHWNGMRDHHLVGVRVNDEHYLYLQAARAAGTPTVTVIREALNAYIAARANAPEGLA